MFWVSCFIDYVIVVMICIVVYGDDVFSIVQIVDEVYLELFIVSKLFKLFGYVGLVELFCGVNGGYWLVCFVYVINFVEIVEVMEGCIGMIECGIDGQCDCELQCGVCGSWWQINYVLDSVLCGVSLVDMFELLVFLVLVIVVISEIKGRIYV